jgi:polyphosphate kinase 2 (PPK2 family)
MQMLKSAIRTKKLNLVNYPTTPAKIHETKALYKSQLRASTTRIANLQRRMAAQGRDSLLVIFEGLDASRKDGAIQRIFRRCDPQSCRIFSFQTPDAGERRHEFLAI